MADTQTQIQKISKETLRELLGTLEAVFPKELGIKDFYGESKTTWSIPEIGLAYKSTQSNEDLEKWVEDLTEQDNIRRAYAKIFEELEAREVSQTPKPEYSKEDTTELPTSTTVEGRREELIEQLEKIQQKQPSSSDKIVREAIAKKQDIYKEQQQLKQNIADARAASAELKDKVIYASVTIPEIPPLDPKDMEAFQVLRNAAQASPEKLEEDLEKKILEKITPELKGKLSPEEIELMAKSSATDIVDRLNPQERITPAPIQTAILYNVYKDTKVVPEVVKSKKAEKTLRNSSIALALNQDTQGNEAIASAIFNKNLAKYIYYPVDVTLSTEKPSEGYSQVVYLEDLNKESIKLQESQDKTLETIKDLGVDEAKSVMLSNSKTYFANKIQSIPAVKSFAYSSPEIQGIFANYGLTEGVNWQATNWTGQQIMKYAPEYAPYVSGAGKILGFSLGVEAASYIPLMLYTEGAVTTFGVTAYEVGYTAIASTEAITTMALPYAYTATTIAGAEVAGQVVTKTVAPALGAGATGAATGVAAGAVAKTGISALVSKATAAIGGLIGNIPGLITGIIGGEVLGKVFKKIAEKIDWTKVKKFFSENGPIMAVILVGGGVFLRNPFMLATGGALGAATVATGGLATVGAGFVGAWMGIKYLFKNLIGPSIIAPIAITMLVLPVLVAFIMFVINSGAYLVPPSPLSSVLSQDNPYMSVTKTANPKKADSPTSVTYTVEITALKGNLTNLQIVSTSCDVIKNNGTKTSCPNENIPNFEDGSIVSPAGADSFTFTVDYDQNYQDSLVFDSIEISATNEEGETITTTGSASVCFGDCPLDCVKVEDSSWSSDSNGQNVLVAAASELSGNYPDFMAKVCSSGQPVNLCYSTSDPSPIGTNGKLCDQAIYARHIHTDACDINFNQCGTKNPKNALFLLTHELTHHIQKIDGGSVNEYKQSGGFNELGSSGFCSYSATKGDEFEAMAEANGLYASIPSWGSCVSNYQSQYPLNYSYAKKFMSGQ